MQCNQENLQMYLDGEMDALTRKEMEEHLARCPSCRREMGRLQLLWLELGQNDEEKVPAELSYLRSQAVHQFLYCLLYTSTPIAGSFPGVANSFIKSVNIIFLILPMLSSLSMVLARLIEGILPSSLWRLSISCLLYTSKDRVRGRRFRTARTADRTARSCSARRWCNHCSLS